MSCIIFDESAQNIWSCGRNYDGEIGHGDTKHRKIPTLIKFFKDNDIRIQKIASGSTHNMVLTTDGEVYTWGGNAYNQCGHDELIDSILTPKLLSFEEDIIIEDNEPDQNGGELAIFSDTVFIYDSIIHRNKAFQSCLNIKS